MNAPDNTDYLFKRLRELKDDKDFYLNEEAESFIMFKKLTKINVKISIITYSLANKGYNM